MEGISECVVKNKQEGIRGDKDMYARKENRFSKHKSAGFYKDV